MKPLFVTVVGSKLYGLSVDGISDTDIKGISFGEVDELIGLKNFEQQTFSNGIADGPEKIEGVLYAVDRYLNLCLKGNPTVIEIAFADPKFWLYSTAVGIEVINFVKENFLTKALFRPYSAYHMAQIRKLENCNPIGKRAELVKEFSFDVKHAMHAYRLARQCSIIMEEGTLRPTLDPEDKEICMKIRKGEYSKEEALNLLKDVDKQMYDCYQKSTLPEAPDFNKVNDFIAQLHKDYLAGKFDNQFLHFNYFSKPKELQWI